MPDPIDAWFPPRGPCQICGVPGVDQRHRVIEAIADAVDASNGDAEDDLAADYGVQVEAVRACVQWKQDHPDGKERAGEDVNGISARGLPPSGGRGIVLPVSFLDEDDDHVVD